MARTIKKEHNGTYTVRVWAEHKDIYGKRRTKYKSNIKTAKQAENIACSFEAELENNLDVDIKFNKLIDIFMKSKKNKIAPTTYSRYEILIDRLNKQLGNVKIKDINTRTIQEFIDLLDKTKIKNSTKTLSKGTQEKYYRFIQSVLNYGVKYDYLPYNKVKNIEFNNNKKQFEALVLSPDEINQLLKEIKINFNRIYIPVLLCSLLGLRRSEALGLKWDSVDFENRIIDINNTITLANNVIVERERTKSRTSKRLLYLSDFLYNELLEHRKQTELLNPIYICQTIWDTKLIRPDYLTKTFIKYNKKINDKHIRLHDLRHSFNQIAYENNIDDKTRSKILGHSNVKITNNVYTHLSASKSKNAINTISNLIINS